MDSLLGPELSRIQTKNSPKHKAREGLQLYILQVEATITSPEVGMKIKQNNKSAVEAELAKALDQLEIQSESYITQSPLPVLS